MDNMITSIFGDDNSVPAFYDPGMPRPTSDLPSPKQLVLRGVHKIRHQNLLTLISKMGGAPAVYGRVPLLTSAHMSQMVRKTRGMGAKLARRIEGSFSLAEGAMDLPDLGLGGTDRKGKTAGTRSIKLLGSLSGESDSSLIWTAKPAGSRIGFQSADPGTYGVEINGDWGHPRTRHGEILIVEPNSDIEGGDLVLFALNDGRHLVGVTTTSRKDHYSVTGVIGTSKPTSVIRSSVSTAHKVSAILLSPGEPI